MDVHPSIETVVVDPDYTLMYVPKPKRLKAFAGQLVRKEKAFSCWPDDGDGGWFVRVEEVNEFGGMAGRWAD